MASDQQGSRGFRAARRAWILVTVCGLTLSGCARTTGVHRVGILYPVGGFGAIVAGFRARMAELGYVEGQGVVYDVQESKDDRAEMRRIADRFVKDNVDLIFAVGTPPTLMAKEATQGKRIPVVFAYAGVEGTGVVRDVREPGGTVTGVRYAGPEQIVKRLEILLEIAPQARRVWVGYDRGNPNNTATLEALRRAASSNGVTLLETPAATLEEMGKDLAAREASTDVGMDAIILMPDGFNNGPQGLQAICGFARRHRIPVGGSFRYTVEAGALFGNADNLTQVGGLAAPLVDKIFHDIPAGTIPVVTPESELWVNNAVAKELGLLVPEGLLRMASGILP